MPILRISKLFGLAVRNRRMAAGLSQEKLADGAGLHPTYVSMVERGVRNPTLDVSARIAKALKVSLPKLIEEAQQQGDTAKLEQRMSAPRETNRRQKPERLRQAR
jgi:transcriptional regulator with XRE-family HTH domain